MPDPAYHPLVRSIARSLRRRCGVVEGDRLLLAVSGGADSVALLRAVALLAPRRKWRLRLAIGHVQHHLRNDAEDDARFVAELAKDLRLPFARRDLALRSTENMEAQARKARYAALAQMALETNCRYVATAHHADDQLETTLMRMLRGTGVAGLRGIAWRRQLENDLLLVRPMLATTHTQALDFLTRIGQAWREDHTNSDTQRTRARLRHEVLPVLRELSPSAARKAVELGDAMRHAKALMDEVQRPQDEGG